MKTLTSMVLMICFACVVDAEQSSEETEKLLFDVTLSADSRCEVSLWNRSTEHTLISDTVFNTSWHVRDPLGATVFFRTRDGILMGVDQDSNFALGWNPVIANSQTYLASDYVRLVRSGERLDRSFSASDLIERFKEARGNAGIGHYEGEFVIVVRIAVISCGKDGSWSVTQTLQKSIEIAGQFDPLPNLYNPSKRTGSLR